jgi:hypothetical protein
MDDCLVFRALNAPQASQNPVLGVVIDVARRFVDKPYRLVLQYHPNDSNALLLTGR